MTNPFLSRKYVRQSTYMHESYTYRGSVKFTSERKRKNLDFPGKSHGGRKEKIHLSHVNCRVGSSDLSQCTFKPWGDHNCAFIEDIELECATAGKTLLKVVQYTFCPSYETYQVKTLTEWLKKTVYHTISKEQSV